MIHGNPHNPSCKTDLSCPNHRTHLMTCREAAIRYRGDYSYRKAVDAGRATAEREVFAKPERPKVPKAPKIPRGPKPARAKAEPRRARQTKGAFGPDGLVHGTQRGYARGCRDNCPAADAGFLSCTEFVRDRWRKASAKVRQEQKTNGRTSARHGTVSGYQQFKCRSRTDCPGAADGGISCGQAKSDYWHSRKAA